MEGNFYENFVLRPKDRSNNATVEKLESNIAKNAHQEAAKRSTTDENPLTHTNPLPN